MTSSGGVPGASHVLLVGITETADRRVKKSTGDAIRVMSLFAERCYGSLKIEGGDGAKQARQLKQVLPKGLRTSQLLVVVLPFASVERELKSEIDSLGRNGAQVEVLAKGANGLPTSVRTVDQKVHDAIAAAVLAVLRQRGGMLVGKSSTPSLPSRTIKLKVLRGLAAHRKWGPYNHSSEDDFWSGCRHVGSADRDAVVKDLLDASLIGTKVNDGDNGKGQRFFLRPENKGLLIEQFPELKPYT